MGWEGFSYYGFLNGGLSEEKVQKMYEVISERCPSIKYTCPIESMIQGTMNPRSERNCPSARKLQYTPVVDIRVENIDGYYEPCPRYIVENGKKQIEIRIDSEIEKYISNHLNEDIQLSFGLLPLLCIISKTLDVFFLYMDPGGSILSDKVVRIDKRYFDYVEKGIISEILLEELRNKDIPISDNAVVTEVLPNKFLIEDERVYLELYSEDSDIRIVDNSKQHFLSGFNYFDEFLQTTFITEIYLDMELIESIGIDILNEWADYRIRADHHGFLFGRNIFINSHDFSDYVIKWDERYKIYSEFIQPKITSRIRDELDLS